MKLAQVTNPITGEKINVTSWKTWVGLILGFFVLMVLFNLARALSAVVTRYTPGWGKAFTQDPTKAGAVQYQGPQFLQ